MSKGLCFKCEFYHDGECKRAENNFASMTDIRCLLKTLCMQMRILCDINADMAYDSDDEDGEPESYKK